MDREIDDDPADRRHRVGAVADAQEPRPPPPFEAIAGDGEQLHIVPVVELRDAVAEEGCDADDVALETGEPALADTIEPALADHKGALPVIAAVKGHQHPAIIDAPQ